MLSLGAQQQRVNKDDAVSVHREFFSTMRKTDVRSCVGKYAFCQVRFRKTTISGFLSLVSFRLYRYIRSCVY